MYTFREIDPTTSAADYYRADEMLCETFKGHDDSLFVDYAELGNMHVAIAKTFDNEVVCAGVLLNEISSVTKLAVREAYRNQRIGSQIMTMLEAAARRDHLDELKVFVPSYYLEAQNFFERRGYKSDGLGNDEFFKQLRTPVTHR